MAVRLPGLVPRVEAGSNAKLCQCRAVPGGWVPMGDVREPTEGCPWLISSPPPCLPSSARVAAAPARRCRCECLERGEGALRSRSRCPAPPLHGAPGLPARGAGRWQPCPGWDTLLAGAAPCQELGTPSQHWGQLRTGCSGQGAGRAPRERPGAAVTPKTGRVRQLWSRAVAVPKPNGQCPTP